MFVRDVALSIVLLAAGFPATAGLVSYFDSTVAGGVDITKIGEQGLAYLLVFAIVLPFVKWLMRSADDRAAAREQQIGILIGEVTNSKEYLSRSLDRLGESIELHRAAVRSFEVFEEEEKKVHSKLAATLARIEKNGDEHKGEAERRHAETLAILQRTVDAVDRLCARVERGDMREEGRE